MNIIFQKQYSRSKVETIIYIYIYKKELSRLNAVSWSDENNILLYCVNSKVTFYIL